MVQTQWSFILAPLERMAFTQRRAVLMETDARQEAADHAEHRWNELNADRQVWLGAANPRIYGRCLEDRRDLDEHRERLWKLISETPKLDWLLLTKRSSVASRLAPWGAHWPENVWLGTTVELQSRAEENLPVLADISQRKFGLFLLNHSWARFISECCMGRVFRRASKSCAMLK